MVQILEINVLVYLVDNMGWLWFFILCVLWVQGSATKMRELLNFQNCPTAEEH